MRLATILLLAATLTAAGCDAAERPPPEGTLAPQGDTPGRRLPWPEASAPVGDWSFATGEQEIALETIGRRAPYSVTVWSVVVAGRLYVATDDGREKKRWVAHLDRDPDARVGMRKATYRVRARPVHEQREWDMVMTAFGRKYGAQLARYDFPRVGHLGSGRVFELVSRR